MVPSLERLKDPADPQLISMNSERKRIVEANGSVINGRLFGVLAVSRAFGDNDFKTARGPFKDRYNGNLVCAIPDIVGHVRSAEDEFLILACDGIFDVMSPSNVVRFVQRKIYEKLLGQQICKDLISYALKLGSSDNVSAIIIFFHPTIKMYANSSNAPKNELMGVTANGD